MPMQQVALEELTKYSRGTEQLRWKPLKSERGNHPAFISADEALTSVHVGRRLTECRIHADSSRPAEWRRIFSVRRALRMPIPK